MLTPAKNLWSARKALEKEPNTLFLSEDQVKRYHPNSIGMGPRRLVGSSKGWLPVANRVLGNQDTP